jgi:hypothetical protein
VHKLFHGLAAIALAACVTHDGGDDAPDNRPPGAPPANSNCYLYRTRVSCSGSTAVSSDEYFPGSTSSTLCTLPPITQSVTCADGCALESMAVFYFEERRRPADVPGAGALCQGAAQAQLGDACVGDGACMPTTARLADDGTVVSTGHLVCRAGACAEGPGPTIERYLEACSAATTSQHGPGTLGVIASSDGGTSCLLVWDEAAQAIASGVTRTCIGDWQCPAGSLCDDQLPELNDPQRPMAVCKPGPRGALTPAMLAR